MTARKKAPAKAPKRKQTPKRLSGRCLCGAVAFAFEADKRNVTACHCSQCRQWAGNFWTSVNAPFAALKFSSGARSVSWFRSSSYARRGFCKTCGASLFWQADRLDEHKDRIAIAAGCVDSPTGLQLTEHIFTASKGDYYAIADGVPQKERF